MPHVFAVTFDYLCPFARNFSEHVLAGLDDGADWEVTFTAYSLAQGHVEEGDVDVWDADQPAKVSGLLALQAGLVVRDRFPARFVGVHRALFAARHDHGQDIKDREVVRGALRTGGVHPDEVFEAIDCGDALNAVRADHDRNVERQVWGVPTVVTADRAVFVRLLNRPEDDIAKVRARVERIVEMVDDLPELHEFKQVELTA